jgi:osmotically-inducible protein OsmY
VADEAEKIADHAAGIVSRILAGEDAGTLPVEFAVDPLFTINIQTTQAVGIRTKEEWADALLVMETLDVGASAPSMEGVAAVERSASAPSQDLRSGDAVISSRTKILAELPKRVFQLPDFSAFDAVSPKVGQAGDVALLGYVYRPQLRQDLESSVATIPGVQTVANRIEILPRSVSDDRLRIGTYAALYGHPELSRYLPSRLSRLSRGANLNVSLQDPDFPQGPHPIQILVKRGHVALIGSVSSESHRKLAESQTRSVAGVASVENYLKLQR